MNIMPCDGTDCLREGCATEPTPIDLVRELRETLGMFAGAMPISPKQAWGEALAEVRRLLIPITDTEGER